MPFLSDERSHRRSHELLVVLIFYKLGSGGQLRFLLRFGGYVVRLGPKRLIRYEIIFEFFEKAEDLLEWLELLLDALSLPVGANLEAESQRNRVKGILAPFITVQFPVFEQFVFRGDLLMMLEMVDHLAKVM